MKKFFIIFFLFSSYLYSQETLEKNYTSFSEFLTEQNTKISNLKNGLSLIEVKEIMGTTIIVKIPKTEKIKPLNQLFKQPEFTKKIRNNASEIRILWYFSTPKNQDGIISKSECTPVVIKNNSVVGKGTKFYLNFMRKELFK